MYTEPSYFKTPRELNLEKRIADLERALYRAKYGDQESLVRMPHCEEMIRQGGPPDHVTVRVPRVVSIECQKHKHFPRHLSVAARVLVPKPFGLNYYCDASLLANTDIAAQVLAINHERFVKELANFVQMENGKNETSPNA